MWPARYLGMTFSGYQMFEGDIFGFPVFCYSNLAVMKIRARENAICVESKNKELPETCKKGTQIFFSVGL